MTAGYYSNPQLLIGSFMSPALSVRTLLSGVKMGVLLLVYSENNSKRQKDSTCL